MLNVSWTKLVITMGGIALSLSTGVAVASAQPDLGPLINTTCTYPQAVAALNAENPAAAQDLSDSPVAQTWLQTFLGSPPDQRQSMAQQVQGVPAVQRYVGVVAQVAGSCSRY
jgi:hemophore-related protein